MSDTGRYLYAVTRDLPPEATAGVAGVGDAPVEVLEHRGLTVLVSTVALTEFGEEPLRQHLEDLAWLERTARAHDAVVRLAADRGATAPLRMLSIVRDDDSVRERLDGMHDDLEGALERVGGRHEWSVKLVVRPAERAAERTPPPTTGGGGAAYLRAKKEAAESRATQDRAATAVAGEIHDALSLLAVADRRLTAQDPRLTGVPGTMVLNAAYLVEDDESDRFATEVARLARQHPDLRLSVDGPWPAYSFATLEGP